MEVSLRPRTMLRWALRICYVVGSRFVRRVRGASDTTHSPASEKVHHANRMPQRGVHRRAGSRCPRYVSAFAADQIPNLKGKWVGKTHTIVAGAGAHWPSNKGTFDKPGLFEKDLVIEITGQQDNRFWGNQTLSGNGEMSSDEPMIGEIAGPDYKRIILSTLMALCTVSWTTPPRCRSATSNPEARRRPAW